MLARLNRARLEAPAGIARPGLFFACVVICAAFAFVLWAPLPGGPRSAEASGKKKEIALGVYFGGGNYDNTDFNADLVKFGYDKIESGIEYGFGVDYRLSEWFSVGFGAVRIGADTVVPLGSDTTNAPIYGVHGSPLFVNFIAHAVRTKRGNFDVFVGAGPLLNASVSTSSGIFEFEGRRTGTYLHAGGALEYRFSPMIAIGLSGLARRAREQHRPAPGHRGSERALGPDLQRGRVLVRAQDLLRDERVAPRAGRSAPPPLRAWRTPRCAPWPRRRRA